MNKETINKLITEEVPFYGDKLIGGKDDNGVIWLAVNPTCRALGFTEDQSKKQKRNIEGDLVLNNLSAKFGTGVKNKNGIVQNRELFFISEKGIPIWLAKISLTPTMKRENPKLVEKLVRYQLECAEVLHNHFMGTDEKKESFFKEGVIETTAEIQYFTIKDGLTWVDTPGIHSLTEENEDEYMPSTDQNVEALKTAKKNSLLKKAIESLT